MPTFVVDQSGGGDATTINGAVALASSGDTISILRGEYQENVSDSGKDLLFEGTGLVLVKDGGLGTGFLLTGNSILVNIVIDNYATGVDGGFLVSGCQIENCSTGALNTQSVENSLLQGNTTGTDGVTTVEGVTLANGTTGAKNLARGQRLVFASVTDCFDVPDNSADLGDICFDSTITNYARIFGSPITTLSGFNAQFGEGSGEDVSGSFFDPLKGFYGSAVDFPVGENDPHQFPCGNPRFYAGASFNRNDTYMRRALYSGGASNDGTKAIGPGTVATAVMDLKGARGIAQVLLLANEDITGGDKIEKTAGLLDVEYRGSNTRFEEDDGVIPWLTVGRRSAPAGSFRYWQFRMTFNGAAELFGIALALTRRTGDIAQPTWTGVAGVNSVVSNTKNGAAVTFHPKDDPDARWRLYVQLGTDAGLFNDANLVGEFSQNPAITHQLADGSFFLDDQTYFFGARIANEDGVTDANAESFALLFNVLSDPLELPDIEGQNLGGGRVRITLTDAPTGEPNFNGVVVYRERSDGFTEALGTLSMIGESIEKGGFRNGDVEVFTAVTLSLIGTRSHTSEEVRLLIAEPDVVKLRESIYS